MECLNCYYLLSFIENLKEVTLTRISGLRFEGDRQLVELFIGSCKRKVKLLVCCTEST